MTDSTGGTDENSESGIGRPLWTPPLPADLALLFPKYQITSLLGQGGMGAVYRAHQLSLDRPAAIKVLPIELATDDPNYIDRFESEAKTMARMSHPNIVQLYEFGRTEGGQLYLVMEYIEGTDVNGLLEHHGGRLPPDQALAITAHLLDALHYAHENGVVHRDIKPSNVMIDQSGRVRVADFGLAQALDTEFAFLSGSSESGGTPSYIAPEAFHLGVELDQRADFYATGVMLHQMLTGRVPRGHFKAASQRVDNLDPRFDAIIRKALCPFPVNRYQSAAEMRKDLDEILTTPETDDADISKSGDDPVASASSRQQSSWIPWLIGAGSLSLIGAGAGFLHWWSLGRNEPGIGLPLPGIDRIIKTDTGAIAFPDSFPLPVSKRPPSAGKLVAWRFDGKAGDMADPEAQFPEELGSVAAFAIGVSGETPRDHRRHGVALRANGTVKAWGHDHLDQCQLPKGLGNVVSVVAGDGFTLALQADGSPRGYGRSIEIPDLETTERIVQIAASKSNALLLSESGKLHIVGNEDSPITAVPNYCREKVVAIGASDGLAAALRQNGDLILWGERSIAGEEESETFDPPLVIEWRKPDEESANRYQNCRIPVSAFAVVTPAGDLHVLLTPDERKQLTNHFSRAPGPKRTDAVFALANSGISGAARTPKGWVLWGAFPGAHLEALDQRIEGCHQIEITNRYVFGIIDPLSEDLTSAPEPSVAKAATKPEPETSPSEGKPMKPVSWTDRRGRTFEANFVGLNGQRILLEKDGQTAEFAFSDLAPESLRQGLRLAAPARKGTGSEPDPTRPPIQLPMAPRPLASGRLVAWRMDGKAINLTEAPEIKPPRFDDVVSLEKAFATDAKRKIDGFPEPMAMLALRDNGNVVAWGNDKGPTVQPPSDLGEVVSLDFRFGLAAALQADGKVRIWGRPAWVGILEPETSKWRNVVRISTWPNGMVSALTSEGSTRAAMLEWKDGKTTGNLLTEVDAASDTAIAIPSNDLGPFRDFVLGWHMSLALRHDGQLLFRKNDSVTPAVLHPGKPIVSLISGHDDLFYLTDDQKIGSANSSICPEDLKRLRDHKVQKVRVWRQMGAAKTEDGNWLFWTDGKPLPFPFDREFCEREAKGSLDLELNPPYVIAIKP